MAYEAYVASRDIVDSLKVDISAATPQQNEQLRVDADRINQCLLQLYGSFIPELSVHAVKGIGDRIILVDGPEFERFHYDWNTVAQNRSHLFYPEVTGTMFSQGRIIVFGNQARNWEVLSPEAQAGAISRFGTEERAREAVTRISFLDQLAHEVSHQYQNPQLPKTYLELGAYFYQRQIARALRQSFPILELNEQRINFYAELLTRYGDDIHRLFFGQEMDEEVRASILSELTPEVIATLFPNQMGL